MTAVSLQQLSKGPAAPAWQREVRTESLGVRVALIVVGLGFLALFLALPLVAVFFEAFRRGFDIYVAALMEPA
ncbi:MAG: sulfate/thiosulfate ABC transporter permease CysW, partial [Alphaproteobacteria bacterium]